MWAGSLRNRMLKNKPGGISYLAFLLILCVALLNNLTPQASAFVFGVVGLVHHIFCSICADVHKALAAADLNFADTFLAYSQ